MSPESEDSNGKSSGFSQPKLDTDNYEVEKTAKNGGDYYLELADAAKQCGAPQLAEALKAQAAQAGEAPKLWSGEAEKTGRGGEASEEDFRYELKTAVELATKFFRDTGKEVSSTLLDAQIGNEFDGELKAQLMLLFGAHGSADSVEEHNGRFSSRQFETHFPGIKLQLRRHHSSGSKTNTDEDFEKLALIRA